MFTNWLALTFGEYHNAPIQKLKDKIPQIIELHLPSNCYLNFSMFTRLNQ